MVWRRALGDLYNTGNEKLTSTSRIYAPAHHVVEVALRRAEHRHQYNTYHHHTAPPDVRACDVRKYSAKGPV